MERVISEILDLGGIFFGSVLISCMLNRVLTPKSKKIVNVLIFSISTVLLYGFFIFCKRVDNYFGDILLKMNVKTVLSMLLLVSFIFLFYKDNFKEKLKTFIILLLFVVFFETTVSFIVKFILADNYNLAFKRGTILEGVISFATFTSIYLLVSICTYVVRKKFEVKVPRSVLLLFGTVVFLGCITVAFAANIIIDSSNKSLAIMFFAMPIIFLLLYILNYYLVLKLSEEEKLKEKLYWMNDLKLMNLSYYEDVQKKYTEMRKFRHDIKDNLETLRIMIDSKDCKNIDKANQFLENLSQKLDDTKLQHFTENVVVNTIISNEAEKAKAENIDFKAEVNIPDEITGIELADLNCIFLNVIKNAIESAKSGKGEGFVKLKSGIKSGYLVVKTVNNFEGERIIENGKIKTTKKDGESHGIGISLMEEITKKYDGSFNLKFDENICTTVLILKI